MVILTQGKIGVLSPQNIYAYNCDLFLRHTAECDVDNLSSANKCTFFSALIELFTNWSFPVRLASQMLKIGSDAAAMLTSRRRNGKELERHKSVKEAQPNIKTIKPQWYKNYCGDIGNPDQVYRFYNSVRCSWASFVPRIRSGDVESQKILGQLGINYRTSDNTDCNGHPVAHAIREYLVTCAYKLLPIPNVYGLSDSVVALYGSYRDYSLFFYPLSSITYDGVDDVDFVPFYHFYVYRPALTPYDINRDDIREIVSHARGHHRSVDAVQVITTFPTNLNRPNNIFLTLVDTIKLDPALANLIGTVDLTLTPYTILCLLRHFTVQYHATVTLYLITSLYVGEAGILSDGGAWYKEGKDRKSVV